MSRRAAGVPVTLTVAASIALMCVSGTAHAQFTPTGDNERRKDPEMEARTERAGLVVSLMLGYGLAQQSGYPNDSNKIGNPSYFSSSDIMLGSSAGIFIGAALADYVNFGFFLESQSFKSNDWKGAATGFGLRVETFPMVYAFPKLKNLGFYGQFGLGAAKLDVVAPGYPEATGVQSFVGFGGMYEWKIFRLFGGHAVAGPFLEYDGVFSQAISSSAGILGGRIAFYSGI